MEPEQGFISDAETERQLMKEDVIKLIISLYSSSSSCSPNSSNSTAIESSPQTEKLKLLIQNHLPSLLTTNLTTPTHPPYAVMIMEAVKELNEEGGSNESAISNYIATNFEDLPFAQSLLLKHHLNKLADMGEIILSSNSCYFLLQNPYPNPKKQRRKRCRRRPHKKQDSDEEEKTDMVQSSLSSYEKDLIVFGDSNKSTAVIEVEPLMKQLPVEEHPTVGLEVGPEPIPSCDVNYKFGDGNKSTAVIEVEPLMKQLSVEVHPTVGLEVGPEPIPICDVNDNQTVAIAIGPTVANQQIKRRGRHPKKREETIIQTCGVDGAMVLSNEHQMVGIGKAYEAVRLCGVDDDKPTVGIEMGPTELEQPPPPPPPPPIKRRRRPKSNTDEVKGSENIIHTCGEDGSMVLADRHPTVGIEVGPLQQRKNLGRGGRPRKKLDTTIQEQQKTSDSMRSRDHDNDGSMMDPPNKPPPPGPSTGGTTEEPRTEEEPKQREHQRKRQLRARPPPPPGPISDEMNQESETEEEPKRHENQRKRPLRPRPPPPGPSTDRMNEDSGTEPKRPRRGTPPKPKPTINLPS